MACKVSLGQNRNRRLPIAVFSHDLENTITFRTHEQKALWNEIRGQLSDGYWENARPVNHWKIWCLAKVEVGPNPGRNFYAEKCNYNLAAPDLLNLDIVLNRMTDYVMKDRVARNVSGLLYTKREIRRDLKEMMIAIRTKI